MKLDCGLSWKERRELRESWHLHFCFIPRRVGHRDCRWLEFIERKGEYIGGPLGPRYWSWKYRRRAS
jgi:hypothetical protein